MGGGRHSLPPSPFAHSAALRGKRLVNITFTLRLFSSLPALLRLKHFYPALQNYEKPLLEATLVFKDVFFMVPWTGSLDFCINKQEN